MKLKWGNAEMSVLVDWYGNDSDTLKNRTEMNVINVGVQNKKKDEKEVINSIIILKNCEYAL